MGHTCKFITPKRLSLVELQVSVRVTVQAIRDCMPTGQSITVKQKSPAGPGKLHCAEVFSRTIAYRHNKQLVSGVSTTQMRSAVSGPMAVRVVSDTLVANRILSSVRPWPHHPHNATHNFHRSFNQTHCVYIHNRQKCFCVTNQTRLATCAQDARTPYITSTT
jgi:hypothetical protein